MYSIMIFISFFPFLNNPPDSRLIFVFLNAWTLFFSSLSSFPEPCIPENITTVYNHGIGQVMWDLAVGADNYSVEGMTAQGLLISCNTSDNNCALYDLQCGQSYNISVTANNQVCQGMTTATNAADITTGETTCL